MMRNLLRLSGEALTNAIKAQYGLCLGRYSDPAIEDLAKLPGWDGEVASLELQRRKDLDNDT